MLEGAFSKDGWTKVTLGEVATNSTVATQAPEEDGFDRYIIGKHIPGDGSSITIWNEVGDGEFGSRIRTIVKEGDVVCTTRGPKIRVSVATFDCLSAHTNFILRTKDSRTFMQELLQLIASSDAFYEHLRRNFRGSTNLFVNWSDAAQFEFMLPPIQEQARIVEVFDAHRAAYEGLQDIEDRLADVQSAYIEDLLTGRFKTSPSLPIKKLLTEGPRNGKSPAAAEDEHGFRSVSLSAVSNGLFNPEGCEKFVSIDAADAEPFLVKAGDAFAVRGNGNRNRMGKVGLSAESHNDLIYPDLLIRLRFDQAIILKEFAVAQWNHPSVHARLAARAKSSNGIWKINGQDIRAHTLTVPTIDEQRDVVANLEDFQSRMRSILERQRQLHELLSNLHEQAFSATVAP